MAGPNSWILPGKGILGGVYVGPPRPDDPDSEPETPWAKALREAIERQPPGEAERLGTVPEQIRANANSGNPLARPTAALIDWMRQPSAPPQISQKRTTGPTPYYALDIDDRYPNAKVGRAIVNHYADYLDPWIYDEQGRRVIDTPAAYTPNKVGKLPETEKPWWWPMVGGIDLGSNFVGLGAGINAGRAATVGARAAFAASKAAVTEAGMAGKLLNAVREGRLAELAGEGAGNPVSKTAAAEAGMFDKLLIASREGRPAQVAGEGTGAAGGGAPGNAASKAPAAEPVATEKLLNAVREGRLAELAGERTDAAGGGARGNAPSAMNEPNGYHLLGGADGTIFRQGTASPSNLKPRPKDEGVLSFRESLSNSYPLPPGQLPVFRPGKEYRQFDVSKLPPGSVIYDHNPPGHVGVRGVSIKELIDAIVDKGDFP